MLSVLNRFIWLPIWGIVFKHIHKKVKQNKILIIEVWSKISLVLISDWITRNKNVSGKYKGAGEGIKCQILSIFSLRLFAKNNG